MCSSTCGYVATRNGTLITQSSDCPSSYKLSTRNPICFIPSKINYSIKQFDHNCVDGRQGHLCGQCAPDYLIAINSYNLQCLCSDNNCTF